MIYSSLHTDCLSGIHVYPVENLHRFDVRDQFGGIGAGICGSEQIVRKQRAIAIRSLTDVVDQVVDRWARRADAEAHWKCGGAVPGRRTPGGMGDDGIRAA